MEIISEIHTYRFLLNFFIESNNLEGIEKEVSLRVNRFSYLRINISRRGINLSPRGNEFSIRGNNLSPRGNELSIRGNNLSVRGHKLSLRGYELPVPGNELSVSGNNLSIRGINLSPGGNSFSDRKKDFQRDCPKNCVNVSDCCYRKKDLQLCLKQCLFWFPVLTQYFKSNSFNYCSYSFQLLT